MEIPLLILAVLTVVAGFLGLPRRLDHLPIFTNFLGTILPSAEEAHVPLTTELILQSVEVITSLLGIYVAYLFFYRRKPSIQSWLESPVIGSLHRLWFGGWGFDWLYDSLVVRPFLWVARINKDDVIDSLYSGIALASEFSHGTLRRTQTGRVRLYAAGIAVGSVVVIGLVVFL